MARKTLTLACRDIGNESCSHVVEGETAEKTRKRMMLHARAVHSDLIQNTSVEEMEQLSERMTEILER